MEEKTIDKALLEAAYGNNWERVQHLVNTQGWIHAHPFFDYHNYPENFGYFDADVDTKGMDPHIACYWWRPKKVAEILLSETIKKPYRGEPIWNESKSCVTFSPNPNGRWLLASGPSNIPNNPKLSIREKIISKSIDVVLALLLISLLVALLNTNLYELLRILVATILFFCMCYLIENFRDEVKKDKNGKSTNS